MVGVWYGSSVADRASRCTLCFRRIAVGAVGAVFSAKAVRACRARSLSHPADRTSLRKRDAVPRLHGLAEEGAVAAREGGLFAHLFEGEDEGQVSVRVTVSAGMRAQVTVMMRARVTATVTARDRQAELKLTLHVVAPTSSPYSPTGQASQSSSESCAAGVVAPSCHFPTGHSEHVP